MLKRLVRHGNSHALIINKTLLKEAGISDNTIFLITINPEGGLLIQTVKNVEAENVIIDLFREKSNGMNVNQKKILKNLDKL